MMKSSEKLKIERHLAEQEERAERWGVKIQNEHLFNDHVNLHRDRRDMLIFYMVISIVLFVAMGASVVFYECNSSSEQELAQDFVSLKGFCDGNPDGVLVKESLTVDCSSGEIVVKIK